MLWRGPSGCWLLCKHLWGVLVNWKLLKGKIFTVLLDAFVWNPANAPLIRPAVPFTSILNCDDKERPPNSYKPSLFSRHKQEMSVAQWLVIFIWVQLISSTRRVHILGNPVLFPSKIFCDTHTRTKKKNKWVTHPLFLLSSDAAVNVCHSVYHNYETTRTIVKFDVFCPGWDLR